MTKERLGIEEELILGLLSAQELLREGRAVIRDVGLLAHKGDGTGRVALPELLRGLPSGEPTANEKVFDGLWTSRHLNPPASYATDGFHASRAQSTPRVPQLLRAIRARSELRAAREGGRGTSDATARLRRHCSPRAFTTTSAIRGAFQEDPTRQELLGLLRTQRRGPGSLRPLDASSLVAGRSVSPVQGLNSIGCEQALPPAL